MTEVRTVAAIAIGLSLALLHTAAADAAPKVAVSIKPIHALAAGVMAGAGAPELIVRGRGSEHSYALKPSEARTLTGAQLVVWVGEPLETFLVKPLRSVSKATRVLELLELEGLTLLKPREGGVWEKHGHAAKSGGHGQAHGHAHGADVDGHVWLDPDNARIIVAALVKSLSEIDAANRATYEKNGAALAAKLAALDAELKQQMAAIKNRPYIVFHDAYQYFEQRYGLNAVGSITVHPESKPSARRLTQIRDKLAKSAARCVFSEPQYNAALVGTVIEGSAARVGVLDPLGADLPEGQEAYFTMMRNLARSLTDCLGVGS
ncbi:MAG: zinc ABC transporter substrate-binding protein [Alphaproteobacteria bacterium]|nr:zinc ABC transporter substrate-binding protein [Alphaproteobacteria bacterium]